MKRYVYSATDAIRRKIRISDMDESNNNHAIRGGWKLMTEAQGDELACQMSIDNPGKVYFADYDDVMNPSSDNMYLNGQPVKYDDIYRTDDGWILRSEREAIESSSSISRKATGRTWNEFIDNIEDTFGIEIDSADRRKPSGHIDFIYGYIGDDKYELNVTKYFGGGYEVVEDNIYKM